MKRARRFGHEARRVRRQFGACLIPIVGVTLTACLPHEPLPYSPNYSRVTMVEPTPAPLKAAAIHKTHDASPKPLARAARPVQTVVVPDACITPDVTEQPLYLPPGCANNLNLQLMVERPGDLAQGRRAGPAPAAPAVRAAQRYLYGGTEAERRSGRQETSSEDESKVAPPSLPQGSRTNVR
jgi:hypothetical protein